VPLARNEPVAGIVTQLVVPEKPLQEPVRTFGKPPANAHVSALFEKPLHGTPGSLALTAQ
jgi:hypothetical protein